MDDKLIHQMNELESCHWWFVGRRQIVSTLIKRVVRLRPDAKILEVGCGTGGNLEMLSRFGNVIGVEPSETAYELAKSKNVAPVITGYLPDKLPASESSFDLVVILDVLEHVDDDEAALKKLFDLLKPGGYLLLTVPAFPFLWSSHDKIHEHRRRYIYSSISAKMISAGFSLKYISYFNSYMFPLIALVRLLRRRTNTVNDSDLRLPPKVINKFLSGLFGSERIFIGKAQLPVGVSLIVCGIKPSVS